MFSGLLRQAEAQTNLLIKLQQTENITK